MLVNCGLDRRLASLQDTFLDVPLVIKAFGSDHAVGSVEEALDHYVQVELLEDDNQYMCEKCDRKVDAAKVCLSRRSLLSRCCA